MIDTHSHIYSEEFNDDRAAVIERARAAGVSKIFMPNIDVDTIDAMFEVESSYPDYCFSMMGLHPTSVKKNFEEDLAIIKRWLDKREFIGVGEIGIDLYWDKTYINQQIVAFEEQVKWAKEMGLPVVIHSRDSFSEVFSVIDKLWDKNLKGVFHSFTGNQSDAKHILEYGTFFMGLNGVLTFKNSNLREVIKEVPLNRLIIETDAPYLTPVPFRGRRNEPSYVKYVCTQLSEVFKTDMGSVDSVTTQNAEELFLTPIK